MGLEEILSTIKADTDAKYSKTISDAKAEAEKILADANRNSAELLEQRRAQSEKDLQDEKMRSIASARLDAKRKLLEARDEVLTNYEERAMQYLRDFAKSSQYKDFLQRMVNDGVTKIGGTAVVQVNASDKNLLGDPKKSGYKVSPKPINCIGGAIISSEDGKRRVDNTIESIISERKEDLRLKLSEKLFSDSKS